MNTADLIIQMVVLVAVIIIVWMKAGNKTFKEVLQEITDLFWVEEKK